MNVHLAMEVVRKQAQVQRLVQNAADVGRLFIHSSPCLELSKMSRLVRNVMELEKSSRKSVQIVMELDILAAERRSK